MRVCGETSSFLGGTAVSCTTLMSSFRAWHSKSTGPLDRDRLFSKRREMRFLRFKLPITCISDFTSGGVKSPLVLSVGRLLSAGAPDRVQRPEVDINLTQRTYHPFTSYNVNHVITLGSRAATTLLGRLYIGSANAIGWLRIESVLRTGAATRGCCAPVRTVARTPSLPLLTPPRPPPKAYIIQVSVPRHTELQIVLHDSFGLTPSLLPTDGHAITTSKPR